LSREERENAMKRVYTGSTLSDCSVRRSVLESHGIQCVIKNEFLSPLAGGIPAPEVWPELWVLDDERAEEAIRLLKTEPGTGGGRPVDHREGAFA
jgi:Putative prokaryotic signal transducing protein